MFLDAREMASTLKSTCYSCRGIRFNYEMPRGGQQYSRILNDLAKSSGLHGHCVPVIHYNTCRQNTSTSTRTCKTTIKPNRQRISYVQKHPDKTIMNQKINRILLDFLLLFLINYFWAWQLPCSMGNIPSDTPLKETDFWFAVAISCW